MEAENNAFIKWFNHGYKLQQFSPELIELIKPSLQPENENHQAMLNGIAEYEKSQEKYRLTELDNLRNKNKEKGKDIDR